MTKRQTRRTLLALAIGWLAATSAAFAGHPVATDVVPAGSAGYVHFYPQEIRNAPAMNLFHRLLEHVQDEASTLSLTRLGLDLTTLEQATVVFAPVEQLVNAQGEPPCVVVATFAKPFRAEDLRRSIGSEWRDVGSHKRIVFENPASDTSVHVFSETTLVLGPSSGVQWWMNTPGEEGRTSLASLLHNSFGHGHVLLGLHVHARDRQRAANVRHLRSSELRFHRSLLRRSHPGRRLSALRAGTNGRVGGT